MGKIETQWFVDRLAAREMSQRQLAKLMNLDPAAVSYMLRGKRKITLAEAAQLAALLDSTPSEILDRAGINNQSLKRVRLEGSINGNAEIVAFGKGAHDMIEAPGDVPPDTVAYQCRTSGTELDRLDGQIYFVNHTKSTPIQYVEAICVCARKAGPAVVAQIRKGYKRGTYNLVLVGSGKTLEDQELAWASPVTWCKFPV
jgi:transcriptional regulator with XRE-family HTH domain